MNFAASHLNLDYRLKCFPFSGRTAGIRFLVTGGVFKESKSGKYFCSCRQTPFPAAVRGSSTILDLFRLPRQNTRPYRPVA